MQLLVVAVLLVQLRELRLQHLLDETLDLRNRVQRVIGQLREGHDERLREVLNGFRLRLHADDGGLAARIVPEEADDGHDVLAVLRALESDALDVAEETDQTVYQLRDQSVVGEQVFGSVGIRLAQKVAGVGLLGEVDGLDALQWRRKREATLAMSAFVWTLKKEPSECSS